MQRELESQEPPHLAHYLKVTGKLLRLVAKLRAVPPEASAAAEDERNRDTTELYLDAKAHLASRLAEHACGQLDALTALPPHPPLLADAYARARIDAAEARTEAAAGTASSDEHVVG